MKRTSQEKNKAFHKIIRCINSCETSLQTLSCDKMIRNFENLFSKDFPDIHEEASFLYIESWSKGALLSDIVYK